MANSAGIVHSHQCWQSKLCLVNVGGNASCKHQKQPAAVKA